ncbi:hypothetical protein NDU88_002003 [Pleurodeles waltl]|uniref:Uncharacterized protein n=1 Tax=Pleurodeles waltl TaxID=8319 RepID=A0AAV7MUC7_PLEWA|nr:hypothetical protein NDU88_002003 [Pleurodeles waltl]
MGARPKLPCEERVRPPGLLSLAGGRGTPARYVDKICGGDSTAQQMHRAQEDLAGGPPSSGCGKAPRPEGRRGARGSGCGAFDPCL